MVNADRSPSIDTTVAITADRKTDGITHHQHSQLKQLQRFQLIQFYLIKAVTASLIFQGLWSLFKSIKFIFFELPALEQRLHLGQINSSQINDFANKAIIMIISTILSLFFALRISILQSKTAKIISIGLAILLVIGNTQINNFLDQIGPGQLITSTIVETLKSILSF